MIGLTRRYSLPRNDQWSWIDGSPIVGKGHWSKGQPDNYFEGNEFCGMMNVKPIGTWNDAGCGNDGNYIKGYVCQIENI